MTIRIAKLLLPVFCITCIAACKKDKSDPPAEEKTVLLKKMIFNEEERGNYWVFEYDGQDRLSGWKKYRDHEVNVTYTIEEYNNLGQPVYIKWMAKNGAQDSTRYFYNTTTGQLNKIDHLEAPARTDEFTYTTGNITEKAIRKPSTTLYARHYELDTKGNIQKITKLEGSSTTVWELSGYDQKRNMLAQKTFAFLGYHPVEEGLLPIGLVNNYHRLKTIYPDGSSMEIPFQHQYDTQGYIKEAAFTIEGKAFSIRYEYEVK